jgi:hypothetical protein
MMPKPFTSKVVTANALFEGDVVYLAADGDWTRALSKADLFTNEATAALALLDAEARAHEVVGPYLADMVPGPDGPTPVHFREGFRMRGPSNHAHGKQETI